jgi:hypothetical protein
MTFDLCQAQVKHDGKYTEPLNGRPYHSYTTGEPLYAESHGGVANKKQYLGYYCRTKKDHYVFDLIHGACAIAKNLPP